MAFTGTYSENTNIIINTGTRNIYLFKESNVDFSAETITKKININENEILEISENLFKSHFNNTQLNNFFGIQEKKDESNLKYLNGAPNVVTLTKKSIFPNNLNAGLLETRFRDKFIYEHWRDDEYFSGSEGWQLSLNKSRKGTSELEGYTISTLLSSYHTLSIWPLDMFTQSNPGDDVVCGELMWLMRSRGLGSNIINNPVVAYAPLNFIGEYQTRSLPWMAGIIGGSKPFQDKEQFYSKDIVKKYKNYSLVSEYNISKKITTENFSNFFNILKSEELEDSTFYNTGSHIMVNSNDIQIHADKISFNINSVLKMRPYKNFYPVFKTLEAARILSQTLTAVPDCNDYFLPPLIKMVFITALYFGPGVLYSSIKSGMPVGYLNGKNSLPENFFHVPFESIFDPLNFLANKEIISGTLLTQSLNTQQYQSCIKNFLEEVKYTFCKNNSLEYFKSNKEDSFKIFQSGTTYAMDISVNIGEVLKDNGSEFNWIGGVNYIGLRGFGATGFPNTPIWMRSRIDSGSAYNGLSTCRISFSPPTTRKYTIDEIFALSSLEFRIDQTTATSSLSHPDSLVGFYPKITSSFNLFEKTLDSENNQYWNIKSKWEFPFLCMSGAIFTYSSGLYRPNDQYTGNPALNEDSWIGGLWHDFCEVPKENEGLFLRLSDVSYFTNTLKVETASLAQMVGFQNETKRVGELNFSKQISEVLCIVPIKKSNNSLYKIQEDSVLCKNNKKFLKEYIFPPKLDFLLDNSNSSMFFCVEITSEWSRRDLAFIWQNMLPENGIFHKEKNNVYTLDPDSVEILRNEEIYFKVFKCKKRSVTNPHGIYSYNYPYDEMSLIELVQIDIIQETTV